MLAILGGAATAVGNLETIKESALFNIASRTYVDDKFDTVYKKLAGDIDQQGNQINSLANLNAQMTVTSVEDRLETARQRLIDVERDVAQHPDTPSLLLMKANAEGKVKDLEETLKSAKCYRSAIISQQAPGPDCRMLTD